LELPIAKRGLDDHFNSAVAHGLSMFSNLEYPECSIAQSGWSARDGREFVSLDTKMEGILRDLRSLKKTECFWMNFKLSADFSFPQDFV
jgi:hypothetical protein